MVKDRSKFLSWVVFFMVATARMTYAQQLGGLENVLTAFLDIFTSNAMRLVFTVALGGIGIGILKSGDNRQLKDKLIAWVIGLVGVLSASGIAQFFWDQAQ